ncbi:hypothetical protein [Sporomusa sphaeroides]|uniref:Uncharacterized protein n=1 Tax=Sporomusa sphaeroides DSM 2875 TaxID=1337886 RepID=A0ABP2C158_9FIRM|nr:hypothetical protein [Sporomusa sphaeroides]OLS58271.1 hypothetical protein SPSPH_18070 [Sporomusa sphaeroides DSM 2875]CVK17542.1 hypothetical protein SSPH_00176 [Sporomusa sphaeroides DSM 2875]
MHTKQAEYLLLNYPSLSAQLHNEQQNILQRYRQTAFACGIGHSYSYSDSTGSKAVKLVMLEEEYRSTILISRWIDTELRPRDRPLLINRWRRLDWMAISRRSGVDAWTCITAWNLMIMQLTEYLKAYAGHASGAAGVVSVSGRIAAKV